MMAARTEELRANLEAEQKQAEEHERQKQQLAKESVVQPQLNLQDEFASPEKALDEEEQRR